MTEFIIILALVLANGIFAGAEIAVVASRGSRLRELAEGGSGSAGTLLRLRDDPERFLATVQIGITLVSASAAAYGGASIAGRIVPWLEQVPWLDEHAESLAVGSVVIGVSYLSIVLGELVPKSLALRHAEHYALFVARSLMALSWCARPAVWLLSASANVVLRPFGDKTTFTETRHSAEELQQLVEEATKAGTIHPDAGEIASRALELPELKASDVMIPRRDVIMIPRAIPAADLERVVLDHAHSRMPVYDGNIDNIVGYVSVKDLLSLALQREPLIIEPILRPAWFVPEFKGAVELMQEMRKHRRTFAIVVDEQGGTSGIITIEDLVEELVGDIFSEHARPGPAVIKREANGQALVSGAAPVREVNRALELELPEDGSYNTIGGLCLALAGRVPAPGTVLEAPDGIKLEVVDASSRLVRWVRIHEATDEAPLR